MSKKGQNKKLKAINAPKTRKIKRKENVWTIKNRAGAHDANAIPLGIILRDYIKIASNLKEAKNILLNKEVKINGKIKIDYRHGIGLFDTITIEKQKLFFITIFDKNGRLTLKEIKEEPKEKICKITHKNSYKGKVQITTNDGRTFINNEVKVGDSIQVSIPEGKIKKIIKLKENAVVYIIKGSHCSEKGIIKEIAPSTVKREKLVKIEQNGIIFETIAKNIIAISNDEKEVQF